MRERGAVFAIVSGRSLVEAIEGIHRCGLRDIPDYLIVWEREIYLPNKFRRWIDCGNWNKRCRKEHRKLFRTSRKILARIQDYVETESQAKWVAEPEEPAAIIASNNEELDHICDFIEHEIRSSPLKYLSYERNSIYLRFAHANYNKGTSITALGKILEIPVERTFAIGDNHNDLSMLNGQVASMVACPANSVDSVKSTVRSCGGLIATKDAGAGVAQAIDHFFGNS